MSFLAPPIFILFFFFPVHFVSSSRSLVDAGAMSCAWAVSSVEVESRDRTYRGVNKEKKAEVELLVLK